MIIYPGRLILWFAFLLPFSAGMFHSRAVFYILIVFFIGIFMIAVYDLYKGFQYSSKFSLKVPDVIRCSVFAESGILCTVGNDNLKSITAKIKITTYSVFISKLEMANVLLNGNSLHEFTMPFIGEKRGDFNLNAAYIEISSPFLFWNIRRKININNSFIRVFPNLRSDRRSLAGYFLHRENGMHLYRALGHGKEFEKLREYIHGDSMDIISWKATAKRNKPVSKVYRVEQTQNIYAVIDVSRMSSLSLYDSKQALEYFLSSSLILGLIAEQQKDSFGIIAFDSKVCRFIKAKRGKSNYNVCREAVYNLFPSENSPDFRNLFSFIRMNVPKRSLLAFMIDFNNPVSIESFVENVHIVSSKHLLIINAIKHPNVNPLFETAIKNEDQIYSHFANHLRWSDMMIAKKQLARHGVSLTFSEYNKFTSDIISKYVNIKKKQLL